jgi:hypothetical protein
MVPKQMAQMETNQRNAASPGLTASSSITQAASTSAIVKIIASASGSLKVGYRSLLIGPSRWEFDKKKPTHPPAVGSRVAFKALPASVVAPLRFLA